MDFDFSTLTIKNDNNKHLFDEFVKYYKFIYSNYFKSEKSSTENHFKLNAIKKTIQIIANTKKQIISGEQLESIKGIGEKTINRINEILDTGTLSEIKQKEKQIEAVLKLSKIHGIGPVKASKFYEKYNINTIEDLIKKEKDGTIILTHDIKLGIKYYPVLCTHIPQLLIANFDVYLQNIIITLGIDYIAVICGSYRRNKNTSSDIDILISNTKLLNENNTKEYLLPVINLLSKKFIIDNITENSNKHFQGYASFKNIYKEMTQIKINSNDFNINNDVVRIDIKIVPIQSFFTAIMHYTGSSEFNQKIRAHAKSLGMMLNENGLFDPNHNAIKIDSEVDIFKNLMMKYISPEKRY